MNYTLPEFNLSEPERLWLQEVLDKNLNGIRFNAKEIWAKLHDRLPTTFRPVTMDERLISSGGTEIRFLGLLTLTGDPNLIPDTDMIMDTIKSMLLSNPLSENINVEDIAEETKLETKRISLILQMIPQFANFYTGSSSNSDSTLLKSIRVTDDDNIFYNYIQYPGIVHLIKLRSFDSFKKKSADHFAIEEKIIAAEKVDEILERLKRLELGQEVLYTDVKEDLDELKTLFHLGKKHWKQLLIGKVGEMVLSGIISETVSKQILKLITPLVGKLLID